MSRQHQWEPPLPLPSGRRGQTCAVCDAVRLFVATDDGRTVTFYLPPETNLSCEEMEEDDAVPSPLNPPPEE